MRIANETGWATCLKVNADGRIDDYGGCVLFYAQHWANLMECAMANGAKLTECADKCSRRADEDMGQYGVIGYQYGAAVSVLAAHWGHGEELRKWHNLETQIQDEGEKANESGGVLNPALLSIAVPKKG